MKGTDILGYSNLDHCCVFFPLSFQQVAPFYSTPLSHPHKPPLENSPDCIACPPFHFEPALGNKPKPAGGKPIFTFKAARKSSVVFCTCICKNSMDVAVVAMKFSVKTGLLLLNFQLPCSRKLCRFHDKTNLSKRDRLPSLKETFF